MRFRCEVCNKLVDKRAYLHRQLLDRRVDRVYANLLKYIVFEYRDKPTLFYGVPDDKVGHRNNARPFDRRVQDQVAVVAVQGSLRVDLRRPLHPEVAERFKGDENVAEKFAYQQATLQGAYFILAVRAVGLDAGGMGGFENAKVDEGFFAGTTVKSNVLVNIGRVDLSGITGGRLPRYDFDEVCSII